MFFRLEGKLTDVEPFGLKVLSGSGKIEICLRKAETEKRWNGIGTSLSGSETWMPQEKLETEAKDFQIYRPWKLVSNTQITPDVKHYVFQSCDKVHKALTKYERPKMKRYARQKCSLLEFN